MNEKRRKKVDEARVHLMHAEEILNEVTAEERAQGRGNEWGKTQAALRCVEEALNEIHDIPMPK